MSKKKEKTAEQIEADRIKKEVSIEKRLFKSLATRVKNSCAAIGQHAVVRQMEFLACNNTELPNKELSKDRNLEAFKVGIESFKQGVTITEYIKENE